MDLGAGLADFATNALCVQAGAVLALAMALAAAVARARGHADARAARISVENDALRDELWRLRKRQARVTGRRRRAKPSRAF